MNPKALSELLKKVHLQGAIKECVLEIDEDGVGKVVALDLTQSIVTMVCSPLEVTDELPPLLGLTNIGTIIKFLDNYSNVEVVFKFTDSHMTIKPRGKGQLRVLLMKPEEVPTRPVKAESVCIDTFKKECTNSFALAKEAVDQFVYYMGLVGAEGLIVSSNKKGRIEFKSAEDHAEQQFSMPLGKGVGEKEISTTIFAKYFLSILQSLPKTDDEPVIHFGDGSMVLITMDDESFWAVNSLGT